MKNKPFSIIILFSLLLNGCSSNENSNRHKTNDQFLAKFANENFSQFTNKALFVRGFDKGNPIVLVYNNQDENCLFYRVVIDARTKEVKQSNIEKINDNCSIDEPLSKKIAVNFLDYNITYLKIDSNNNVLIRTQFNERPADLIRLSDEKIITSDYKEKEKTKGNNWYERIED